MLFSRGISSMVILALLAVGGFWGGKEALDYWKNKPRKQYYGEETLVQRGFVSLGQWGKRDTKRRENSEQDIIVDEGTRIIKDTALFQKGNITVSGEGRLVFQNSIIEMTPGNELLASILIKDKGEMIFERSTLKPHADNPANLYVNLEDDARFIFNRSEGINKIIAGGNAHVEMNDSIWAYSMPRFAGGSVELRESAQAAIKNSTIGGLIVEFPKEAKVEISKFKPEKFAKFNFGNAALENAEILGDYIGRGGERGLSIVAPADISKLKIIDSELSRLVIQSVAGKLEFSNLKLETPQDFKYNNISLYNSTIMSQWGFWLQGGSAKFVDSQGLGFYILDDAKLTLKNSEMNEFNPRNFTGILFFENSIWEKAGEIIGSNDFLWQGSWFAQDFNRETFKPLLWDDSIVRREFSIDVLLLNPGPAPARTALIEVFSGGDKLLEKIYTDKDGRASFTITFDDYNYRDKFYVKVSKFGKEIRQEINFLTPTPIELILN